MCTNILILSDKVFYIRISKSKNAVIKTLLLFLAVIIMDKQGDTMWSGKAYLDIVLVSKSP